jgi:hypothetical protein
MAAKTKKSSAAKKTPKAAASAVPATTVTPVAKPSAPVAPTVAPAAKPAAPAPKTASAAERAKMIEVTAYLIAEKNGFRGDAKAYWLQAERDVDAKLGKK